jgi:hypothetical protein
VVDAIRADELYVFPHPEMRDEVEARFAAITAAFNKAERPRPFPPAGHGGSASPRVA